MISGIKNEIFEYLKCKRLALLGFGKSNHSVAELLCDLSLDFQVRDKNDCSEYLREMGNRNIRFKFGNDYLQNLDCDLLFLSPGIRPDLSEINSALKNGCILSSEIDLFLKFCPTKNVFAVTGSDGKSTTTSLIYNLLKQSGKDVFMGGNIGLPIISQIDKISPKSFVVLELSSFQLMPLDINPKVAVITNISENHLDWHKDFEEYVKSKFKIFSKQSNNDLLILNADDNFYDKICTVAKSKIISFSSTITQCQCYLEKDGYIWNSYEGKSVRIINKNDIKIPGKHNIENYMAAISACSGFVSSDDIVQVAKNFGGLDHRIEFVREINGIRFYDDSIASTPNRVIGGALSVFIDNIILIAGGYDKHLGFDIFSKVVCDKVKILILMGQTSEKIKKCILELDTPKRPQIFEVQSMKEAVELAYANSKKGDVILLSPACASFGMYKNFEERGNDFKFCVNNIKIL